MPSEKQKQRLALRKVNKAKARERDKHRCRHCKQYKPWRMGVHHVIHLGRGGTEAVNNLVTLCGDCHDQCHFEQEPYLWVRFIDGDFEFSREVF